MKLNRVNPAKMDLMIQKAISETEPHRCTCGSMFFQPATMVRIVSHLRLGTPSDLVAEAQVLLCRQCGKPLQKEQPKEEEQPKIIQ